MEGQSKIDRMRRVMINVMKMFERRGYTMLESEKKYADIVSSNAEVEALYNQNTYFIIMVAVENMDSESKNVRNITPRQSGNRHVIHHMAFIVKESETLKKYITKEITAIRSKYQAKNVNTIVFVRMTGQKKYKTEPNTEVHNFESFLSDTYDHVFAPIYEKIDPVKFARQFDMKKLSDLPKFSSADASAKYLGFKEGDIIKITAKSENSGEKIEYKYVN